MRRVTTWGRGIALAGAALLLVSGCGPVQRIADSLTDPSDAELLAAVSLTEQDAAEGSTLQPYEGGDEVFGQVSLDLCYGDYPSEELRSGRKQVAISDQEGVTWVSSEAILYPTPEDAEQAMGELEAARADCPDGPVDSVNGDRDPLAWEFTEDPDDAWPDEPGVTRAGLRVHRHRPRRRLLVQHRDLHAAGTHDPGLVRHAPRQPVDHPEERPGPGALRAGHGQPPCCVAREGTGAG